MNDSLSPLFHEIRTTDDADILYQKITEMTNALYHTDTKDFNHILSSEMRSGLAQAIRTVLASQQLTVTHTTEVKELLSTLKNEMSSLTVLTLTIAFPPSDESIAIISQKAKALFGITCILEIITQPTLIGGAIIVYKGKYIDSSLKTKIDAVFEKRSKDILEVLTKS